MKKSKIGEHILKYCVIVLGALIFAVGFRLFMYPNNIISGGVTGVAMIINKLSRLPVGVLTIVLNIPLFVLAWKKFGLRFIVDSLVGMLLSSIFVDLLAIPNIVATTEPLLASIIGGVLKGLGLGMIYWEGATTGGSDIVAKLVRKRYPYINFGTIVLVLDAVIIVAFAIIFNDWQAAMYSVIGGPGTLEMHTLPAGGNCRASLERPYSDDRLLRIHGVPVSGRSTPSTGLSSRTTALADSDEA